MNIPNLSPKLKYILITSLIVVLIVLIVIYRIISRSIQNSQNTTVPSPTEIVIPPSITPISVNRVVPTINQKNIEELKYPVKYENITVEYKPRTGTFLVYYQNTTLSDATKQYSLLMQRLVLNPNQFRQEYYDLGASNQPARGYPE